MLKTITSVFAQAQVVEINTMQEFKSLLSNESQFIGHSNSLGKQPISFDIDDVEEANLSEYNGSPMKN